MESRSHEGYRIQYYGEWLKAKRWSWVIAKPESAEGTVKGHCVGVASGGTPLAMYTYTV